VGYGKRESGGKLVMAKQIRQTVNIFFSVDDDYEVTDTETVDNLGASLLDGTGRLVSYRVVSTESIETVDISDLGD
jgi:hypothetical protein